MDLGSSDDEGKKTTPSAIEETVLENESDTDTLKNEVDDQKVASAYRESGRQNRPSFTIGGSDSDSTSVTSSEVLAWMKGPVPPALKTIPSGSGNFSNNGSFSRSSQGHDESPDSHENRRRQGSRTSTSSRGTMYYNPASGASYREIRLFAVSDDASQNSHYTKRQWLTFLVFGLIELFSAMIISLQAPFYPLEAEKKGATATEYCLVFGIFELTVFIISPLYGSKVYRLGPKIVFSVGILLTSLSSIGFGFLDKVEDRTFFIGISIGTRIIEAIGESAFISASFVIIAAEFSHSVANTFAGMETFYGLGLIIGPLVGGLLYQMGGFVLPFVAVGVALFFSAIFAMFALPRAGERERTISTVAESASGFQMFSLLNVPAIALAAFSIFAASASISYLNGTMEPFIRMNNLSPSPVATGALFIINGGVYALSAPFWGWFCDRIENENRLKIVSIAGSFLISVGFGLIGPVMYVPLDTSLWGVIVGQVIQGLGLGAVLVSAFVQSLKEAIKSGLRDDIKTYSLVSGVWTSMFALGAFAGATASGVLYDIVGFRTGTWAIIGLHSLVITAFLISWCCCNCKSSSHKRDERDPLLPQPSTSSASGITSSGDFPANRAVYGSL